MRSLRPYLVVCVACLASLLFGQSIQPTRIAFTQTDVAQVLRAISASTGANIVYSGQDKVLVTVTIQVTSTTDAVKGVVAAAGLAYRRVGNVFVVAKPEGMRQALEPFCTRVRFSLVKLDAEETAKRAEQALPMIYARPAGNKLMVTALPEDVAALRDLLVEWERDAAAVQIQSETVLLRNITAAQLTSVLAGSYPKVKVFAVGPTDAPGGSLHMVGPREDVIAARNLVAVLDVAGNRPNRELAYKVYQIRYSSGPVLKEFVESVVPEVKVTVGPEAYSPMEPAFRVLTGGNLGQSDSQSGGGGGSMSGTSGMSGSGSNSGTSGLGTGTQGVAQPFQKVKEGDRAKRMVLRGPADAVEAAFAILEQMDVQPIQVRVDVRVVDTSPQKLQNVGLEFNWGPFDFVEKPRGTQMDGSPDPMQKTRAPGFGEFSRLPWNFGSVLNALITKKDAKLLANPSISVLDNDDATIFIGDTIRARLAQATGLGAQTVEIREFPVGIVLLLRPRVNADGQITMRVHPIVSNINSVDSDNVPQTSTREAETTVMVKDGETVVIGGLIKDEYRRTTKELPILADLPIIGELFKSRDSSHSQSEVLVFITTTILKDGKAANVPPPPTKPKKE